MIHPAGDRPSSPPTIEPAEPASVVAEAREERGPFRLLLIEDDPSDAAFLEESLRAVRHGPGFRTTRVARLSQAIERLRSEGADVVLVDLNLPDSRGVETATRLLAEQPEAAVVVLTGLEDETAVKKALQGGAQDFLVKGHFEGEVLARALVHAIERRSMLSRLERAAAEARSNEANLRNVIGRSAEGLVVLGPDRAVLFANAAAEALFARDRASLDGAFPWATVEKGPSLEVSVSRPDGTSIPAEMRSTDLEWQGAPALLVSILDLRDRKRGERVRMVRNVQRAFQPERSSFEASGVSAAGLNELCEDASGDYYDFLELPEGRVGVVVGDVSGHGLEAALVMAQGRAALRALCRTVPHLSGIVEHLNDSLVGDLTHGRFMTLFVAAVDPRSGRTEWVNAGHQPALVCRSGTGRVEALAATGVVLGVVQGGRHPPGPPLDLGEGDVLLAYSDGATDAPSATGVRFGQDRLAASLARHSALSPEKVVESVRADLLDWTGGRRIEDDLTLVALARTSALPVGAP